jgi:hypothetical protein
MTAKNLDVVGTSRDQESAEPKGPAGQAAPDPHLSVVCPFPARPARQQKHRGHYRTHGSKYISLPQATNIIEAVKFAKTIGLPLVAHLTIHWSGTVAFDDHGGIRFAKVREGLSKVLLRRGIPVAWIWCRECKAHTDIVHCHLLFHLPVEYRSGRKLAEMEAHFVRLVDRHGGGIWGECAVKLVIWPDPDGLYLIKGGGPKVWKHFPRIRKDWRSAQGVIHGKRCGTSQSLGPTARRGACCRGEADLRGPVSCINH